MKRRILLLCIGSLIGAFAAWGTYRQYRTWHNTKYGIMEPGIRIALKSYGGRARDVAELLDRSRTGSVLGVSDPQPDYSVAVLGDSFVWGQGITDSERFPVLLERMLDAHTPTTVYSLGLPGNSFADNYAKLVEFTKQRRVDLAIIAIVDNDLLLDKPVYPDIQQELLSACPGPVLWYSPQDPYEAAKRNSFSETYSNLCVFRRALAGLAKYDHVVFFDFGSNWGTTDLLTVLNTHIRAAGFPVVTFPTQPDSDSLYVSRADRHPSAGAHRMFATHLYRYITDALPVR